MAMGRQKDGQGDLMVSWSEMPRSPGHVFYDRLQSVLVEGGFDAFAEASCRPYYAARMGAPSVPPGRYFRMHLVGIVTLTAWLRHGRCFSVSGCARYPTVVTAFHRSSSSMPSGSIAVSR